MNRQASIMPIETLKKCPFIHIDQLLSKTLHNFNSKK